MDAEGEGILGEFTFEGKPLVDAEATEVKEQPEAVGISSDSSTDGEAGASESDADA